MTGPDLLDYLAAVRDSGGSDLHLSAGAPPTMRVNGQLRRMDAPPLEAGVCRDFVLSVLTDAQRARLEQNWELDFSLKIKDIGRFRGNAFFSRGNLEASFRYVPPEVPDLESLGHARAVRDFCFAKQGLILVTGMAGTGKSTTLAAMTNLILQQRGGVVVTIEDPIEFVYEHGMGVVKQRQIGEDTRSFAEALRAAVRQDVDVIVVSEMRDQESIAAALTAAETGHLVISTLHTRTAPGTLDRIVDIFPPQQQPQITTQLSGCLLGVINQRLMTRVDAPGRVMASEILTNTPAIAAVIREHRFEQIYGLMQVGAVHGMHTMDDSLLHLLKGGYVDLEEALLHARDPEQLRSDFQFWLKAQAKTRR